MIKPKHNTLAAIIEKLRANSSLSCTDTFLLRHGCIYLLEDEEKVQQLYHFNTMANQIRYTACSGLLQKMRNIPNAIIKGAVLSKHAYGDENWRLTNDVDLLISRSHFSQVKSILLSEGFVQGSIQNGQIIPYSREEIVYHMTQTHQSATFVKPTGHYLSPYVLIDVNFDLFWGNSDIHFDVSEMLKRTHQEIVCDQTVNVLRPFDEFIALCLHHYKHMNSIYLLAKGDLRLYLLCDVLEYLNNNHLDPIELRTLSQQCGALPFVYYCVHYANELIGNNALGEHLASLSSSEGKELLACIGLTDSERRRTKSTFWDRMFAKNPLEILADDLYEDDYQRIVVNQKYLQPQ